MPATYDVKQHVLAAFRTLLVPLVRMLVRSGVTYRDFGELAKEVFVAVGARELRTPERKTTLSRLSIACGLPRREVSGIVLEEARRRREQGTYAKQLANLLEVWHSSKQYVGPYGFPRDLVIFGQDPAGTFELLVEGACEGVSTQVMLRELVRVGAAEVLDGGKVIRVLKRTYIPTDLTAEMVEVFTSAVRRYVQTVDFNLALADTSQRRFDRVVYPDAGIRKEDIAEYKQDFRQYLEKVVAEIELKHRDYSAPKPHEDPRPSAWESDCTSTRTCRKTDV